MREILFKAKRLSDGEWVEGLVACPHCTDTEKGVQSYYFFEIKDGKSYQRIVSAETICQYTGLTDKNGKKIWENDVVKQQYLVFTSLREKEVRTKIGYVDFSCDEYVNGYWAYWWDEKNGRCNFGINSTDCEVIGNIFDNPELMKGAEHETD